MTALVEHTTWARPVTYASCTTCGAELHRVAITGWDEFGWAGPDGHTWAPMPGLPADPWAYLAALDARMTAAGKLATRKGVELTGVYWAAAREYSSLKVRLGMGSTMHEHRAGEPEREHRGPLPWHCGWPGLLRPSGWCCRQCSRRLLPIC